MTKKSPTKKPGIKREDPRNYTALSRRLQRRSMAHQQYDLLTPNAHVNRIYPGEKRGWHRTYSLTPADRLLAVKLLGGD